MISESVTRFFLSFDAPAVLIHEARILVIRRGAEFSLRDAFKEGLRLWIETERKRPRPDDNDFRIMNILNLICCQLLAHSFAQIKESVSESGKLTVDREALRQAKQALFWLHSNDREYPLSYLNVCDFLGLIALRGREWARPYLEVIEGAAPALERRENETIIESEDAQENETGLYLTDQEKARYQEITFESGWWKFFRRPAARKFGGGR